MYKIRLEEDVLMYWPVEERRTRDAAAALGDDEQERPQVGYVPGDCHGHTNRRVHVGS